MKKSSEDKYYHLVIKIPYFNYLFMVGVNNIPLNLSFMELVSFFFVER